MHVKTFRVSNFRRLKDVRVDLEPETSIFVGANNSGKTSATRVFQLFLGRAKGAFSIYDFTADCWRVFNSLDPDTQDPDSELPVITFDLWFEVDDLNVHRVIDLLPGLDWEGKPVGIRLSYAPRDGRQLLLNYAEARAEAQVPVDEETSTYKPWPENLTDYLTKRLRSEYEIKYAILDAAQCDDEFRPNVDYEPFPLGTGSSAAKVIDSLIQVDFLDAQRHLSDAESHGRYEDLSKRLSRFYARNLKQREDDFEALRALADSEARLNTHFAEVFGPVLGSLSELGYPGLGNHELVVRADFNAAAILSGSARVHYALPSDGEDGEAPSVPTLPDQYNGLGFKNLIYMVVEVLDFHHAWAECTEERPPVHLIMIEEPEAHLHAQLQQVFIRKILDVLPPPGDGFQTQMIVTTHSAHIIYESSFKPIRYFRRAADEGSVHFSDVRNLSTFYDQEEKATRDFLLQYLKLTHCDLFFADAAILVEGNVERLLLPLMIQKDCPELRACHLTILEVGGAFAHKFEKLIDFLDLPTLVVTDLDSVTPAADGPAATEEPVDEDEPSSGTACRADVAGAVTSNETLRQWAPKLSDIGELLDADEKQKLALDEHGQIRSTRVAYETKQPATWQGVTEDAAGRTLEEAFALQNLVWLQDPARQHLGLYIRGGARLDLEAMKERIHKRVKNPDKTRFALGLIAEDAAGWTTPTYIVEGLEWLRETLQVYVDGAATASDLEPEVTE